MHFKRNHHHETTLIGTASLLSVGLGERPASLAFNEVHERAREFVVNRVDKMIVWQIASWVIWRDNCMRTQIGNSVGVQYRFERLIQKIGISKIIDDEDHRDHTVASSQPCKVANHKPSHLDLFALGPKTGLIKHVLS